MDLPLPAAGSKRRELILAGGAVLLIGALVYFWKHGKSQDSSQTSVAAATGAAGYTYPMPAGGINTAPGDSSSVNSLFHQQQEILRLLGSGAAAASAGSTGAAGVPDAPRPGPGPAAPDSGPTAAADAPPTFTAPPAHQAYYDGTTAVASPASQYAAAGSYTPPAGMPVYSSNDGALSSLFSSHPATPADGGPGGSSGILVGGQLVNIDRAYYNAHSADINIAANPYMNQAARDAATQRLTAA